MKVKMYLDLYKDDRIQNKNMLMGTNMWIGIQATSNPHSKQPGFDRIAFTIDIPDKYFMEFEDYITGDAVLEMCDED